MLWLANTIPWLLTTHPQFQVTLYTPQTTDLFTLILDQGSSLASLSLMSLTMPKVHPNLLGPVMAQIPSLCLDFTTLSAPQWSSLLFSILDLRRVTHLSLRSCNLSSINPMVLATAVTATRSVDLSYVSYILIFVSFYYVFSSSFSFLFPIVILLLVLLKSPILRSSSFIN